MNKQDYEKAKAEFWADFNREHPYAGIITEKAFLYAFIPNPYCLPVVNHKDENPQNNCVENLEWCTIQYNCEYGTARERQRKSRAANPKDNAVRRLVGDKLSIAVNMLSPDGVFIKSFKSITEASDSTGVDKGTIIAWCKGKRTKSRKYRFEYAV